MAEIRKIAAILVPMWSAVAGSPARTKTVLRRDFARCSALIDPTISVHHGRIVKRTGDGGVIEFRSVVDAVRCAMELQHERNAGVALDKGHRIPHRHSFGRRCRRGRRRSHGRRRQHRRPAGGRLRAGRDLPFRGHLSSGAQDRRKTLGAVPDPRRIWDHKRLSAWGKDTGSTWRSFLSESSPPEAPEGPARLRGPPDLEFR
jgi:hypothetical protein